MNNSKVDDTIFTPAVALEDQTIISRNQTFPGRAKDMGTRLQRTDRTMDYVRIRVVNDGGLMFLDAKSFDDAMEIEPLDNYDFVNWQLPG